MSLLDTLHTAKNGTSLTIIDLDRIDGALWTKTGPDTWTSYNPKDDSYTIQRTDIIVKALDRSGDYVVWAIS